MLDNKPMSPKEAARHFSVIREGNCFAHTIREMERKIYELTGDKRIPFHITIKQSLATNGGSAIVFYHSGCTILLPDDCPNQNNKDVRFILAHELGHISYNAEKLGIITGRTSPLPDEEIYAWEFAYHLTEIRSNGYRNGVGQEHIFGDDDLGKLLIYNVKKQRPDIYENMKSFLDGLTI
ncbi:MAG: hypothetical protein LBC70_10560 [Chitinispirillales bacterium]|jgi:hypothetical protein|nr:hypothetical protein [Chitinispirillales bacterium]